MGFVVDAVGDLGTAVGRQFGFSGGANQFRANAPTIDFQGQNPDYFSALMGQPVDQGQPLGGLPGAIRAAMPGGAPVQRSGGVLASATGANANQQRFIDALQAQLQGSGPSVAQEALKQATQANNAAAASAIGSQRGINPALAAKLILDQQAGQNQQAAGQGALLRAQEMTSVRGDLANALAAQQGGQNQLLAILAGGQQGQNALAQATAGQNAALNLGAQQINAGVAGQNADIASGAIGGLLNGLGSAASRAALPGAGAAGGAGAGAAGGGAAAVPLAMSSGAVVPGRPQVAGDNPRNDTVPANLSPGEIVLPRSVAQAEDAPEKAAAFVRAIRRQKEPEGYGKVLAKMRTLDARLQRMEGMFRGGRVYG